MRDYYFPSRINLMSGRYRQPPDSGDQDTEAAAGAQRSEESKAEADEPVQDYERPGSRYGGIAGSYSRPSNYSRRYGSEERYGQRAGRYYDRPFGSEEERRPAGRFGERAGYEYDEPGYRDAYRPAGDRWEQAASDAIDSWFGDEVAERSRRMDERRQQNRGKGPKNYRRSDKRIREDVNDRLSDDYYVDASDIEVQAKQGLVTLTGTVGSRHDKRRAEDIAESVSGVTDVENRLRVQPRMDQDPVLLDEPQLRDEPYDVARELEQSVRAANLGHADPEANLGLLQTVREAIQEESVARTYVTARYRSLVDRKYLNGLSPSEEYELEALTVTLDEMDEPYYEAITERLRTLIEQTRP